MDRIERLYFRAMVAIIAVIAAICLAALALCELDGEQAIGIFSAAGMTLCVYPMLPRGRGGRQR